MLQFYINQKFFTIVAEDFTILDGKGLPVYRVEGQMLWAGKHLTVRDNDGGARLVLNRRFFSFLTAIDICDGNENPIALFREKFHIGFRQRCYVETVRGERYDIEGNFFGTHYEIFKNSKDGESGGVLVADVEKNFIEFGDKYRVNVFVEEEALTVLATVLCVDMFRVVRQARSSN